MLSTHLFLPCVQDMTKHSTCLSWPCVANFRSELGSAVKTAVVCTKGKFLYPLSCRAARMAPWPPEHRILPTCCSAIPGCRFYAEVHSGGSSHVLIPASRMEQNSGESTILPSGCVIWILFIPWSKLSHKAIPPAREAGKDSFYSRKPCA